MGIKNLNTTLKIVIMPFSLIVVLVVGMVLSFNAFTSAYEGFEDIKDELTIIEKRENIKDDIYRLQIFLLMSAVTKGEDKNSLEKVEERYKIAKESIRKLKKFIKQDLLTHNNEHRDEHHEYENKNEDEKDIHRHIEYLENLVTNFNLLLKKINSLYSVGKTIPSEFKEDYELGVDATYGLLDITTVTDNQFLKLEALTEKNFNESIEDINNKLYNNKIAFTTAGIIGIILSLILSIIIIKSIKNSIYILKNGMLEFFDFLNRKNEKTNFINLDSKDEFGEMAKVINESIKSTSENILENISVVQKVANRNYDIEMRVRSESDSFAKSMNLMIIALRNNKLVTDEQNWIKDGLNELNNKLTGDLSTFEISNHSIQFICNYLKIGIGALYVYNQKEENEEGILKLYGTYAFVEREELSNRYKLGEGIVGQVALQKSPILLKNIKRSQLVITSGTTSEPPLNTYTYPLIHENILYGVIEIASHQAFTHIELEFLNSSNRIIATYLFTSIQNEKIKKFLKNSKKSNEELQETNKQMLLQKSKLEEANAQMEEQQQQLEQSNAQMEEQQQQLEEANAQMEEQQQQLTITAEELSDKNESLTISQTELDKRAKELESSNRYKSEFLANMSHELRTPLNSIILLSKMLSKNKQEHLDTKEVKKVEVINHAGNELLRLINDILDLSKVEAGKMSLNLSEISTTTLLQQFKDMFEHIASDKGLKFIIKDELKTTFINDEDKLAQIIRNLLSNAFKFTKDGYIELGVIDSGDKDREIEIYVKDSGIGIPDKKQKLIFEAFSQADGSTSREYGGTGLGLSITKEFAKLMKSYVKLKSVENEGSIFSIFLPKSAGDIPKKERKRLLKEIKNEIRDEKIEKDIQKDLDAKKVFQNNIIIDDRDNIITNDSVMLIIEDDITFVEILKMKIHNRNLKVLIARSGNEGLRLLREYKIDGILLDLGLPDISGVEVLRDLKQNVKTKHIPVHIISADDKDILPQKLGAIGFIQKPANEEEIDKAIKKLYDTHTKSPKHILIVEDDKNQQDAMISLIEQQGVELKAVDNAKSAIEELEKEFYDTVIIDLGLNNGNGYEICDYIKRNSIETPIIIYTGKDLSEDETNRLRVYTDSIILKTVNSDERLLEDIDLFLHNVKTTTEKPTEKPKSLEVSLDGKNILVVDDDAKNIFVLSSALEEEGVEVIDAKNGQVALDTLRKHKNIDLVLMDIMMPVMDGYEAMSEIRKDEKLKYLPVIAVTAKAMKDDKQKCIDAGADDYISKPLDLDLLIQMVKAWVNKSH